MKKTVTLFCCTALLFLLTTVAYSQISNLSGGLKISERHKEISEAENSEQINKDTKFPAIDTAKDGEQSPLELLRNKKEAIHKRDLFSKHFINDDGSYTALIGAGPIHYKNNGKFEDIDYTIVANGSSTYPYANKTNLMESYFGQSSHTGIKNVTAEGEVLEFLNVKMFWEVSGQSLTISSAANVPISINEDKAYYNNLFGNINAEFIIEGGRRKLNYIIPDIHALNQVPSGADYLVFSEDIELPQGWSYTFDNQKGLLLKDVSNHVIYAYEKPVSTDAENNLERENSLMEVSHSGNILTVLTKVKTSWLLDNSRVFPVKVDPTVNVVPDNTVNWTGYVWSDGEYINSLINTGRVSGYWIQGSIRFNLTSIPSGSTINSALGFINILAGYGTGVANRTWALTNSSDPVGTPTGLSAQGLALYNSMTTAHSATTTVTSLGWRSSLFSPSGRTYLSNALGNGFVAMGLYAMGTWSNGQYFEVAGYSNAARPYLAIDYTVAASCFAGTASGPIYIPTNNTANFTLNGYTGSTIQWQSSPNGSTGWANVTTGTGGATDNYTTAALANGTYYFRAVVTDGGSCTEYSNIITLNVAENPTYCSGAGSGNAFLNNHIESILFHEWSDPNPGYSTNNYLNYSDTTTYGYATVVAGQYHHFGATIRANGTGTTSTTVAAWIDFNNDGIFDNTPFSSGGERIDIQNFSSTVGNTYAAYLTIPNNISGTRRIRIRALRGNFVSGGIDPCGVYTNAQTKDFTIKVLPSIGNQVCNGVNGNANNVLTNSTIDKVYISRVKIDGANGTIIDNNGQFFGVQVGSAVTMYNYSNMMGSYSNGLVFEAGQSYTIEVEHSGYTTACGLFIDYNNDGLFTGPNEVIGVISDPNANPFVFNFTVPMSVTDGQQVAMRVRLQYEDYQGQASAMTGCNNMALGGLNLYSEVEDYRAAMSVPVLPDLPDLIVESITPNITTLCGSGNVNYEVTVRNIGSQAISNGSPFAVSAYIGSTTCGGTAISTQNFSAGLGVNATTTFTFNLALSGNSNVSFLADANNTITEQNETNNCLGNSAVTISGGLSGTYTIPGDFANFSEAATALNTYGICGPVIFEVTGTFNEAITLNAISGSSAINTITFRPAASASVVLNGTATATVNLSGSNYIFFDGRQGGTGTAQNFTIRNSGSNLPAFQFINGASNNTLRYLRLESSSAASTGSVVFLSTGGNNHNLIEYCDITRQGTGRPTHGIYSNGSTPNHNNNITIQYNNIYNFSPGLNYTGSAITATGTGINTNGYGNNWTIKGNSMYNTGVGQNNNSTLFVINLDTRPGSSGHVIEDNFIGGTEPQCGGGIWSTTSNGGGEGTGIKLIRITAPCTISGNNLKRFTASTGSTNAVFLIGIDIESNVAVSISNNAIDSITNTSQWAVCGIRSKSSGTVLIDGNTVSNISGTASSNQVAQASGIYVNSGTNTITNNTVFNISSATNTNTNQTNFAFDGSAAGIVNVSGLSNATQTISGNTVYNIHNTLTSNSATKLFGISISGTANASINHIVNGNLVYGLSAPNSNNSVQMIGLRTSSNGIFTFSNNMIALGTRVDGSSITSSSLFTGIMVGSGGSATNSTTHIYFNSVYIGGTGVASGTINTYAYRRLNTNISPKTPQNIRNNIFVNNRSNTSGTGKHFSMGFDSNNNLTHANTQVDYNAYFGNGTGYVFAQMNTTDCANFATLRTQSGNNNFDLNSIVVNPLFESPDSGTPDLHLSGSSSLGGLGITINGISTDFDNDDRDTPPTIGADEVSNICSEITINTSPTPNSICEGSNTFFTVDASGIGISYQWQVDTGSGFANITNGGNYSGAQSNQLYVNNTPSGFDGYEYRAVISSTCTTAVNSAEVTLTVNSLPNITAEPVDATVASGSNTSFSISATGSGTLTYVWQLSTDGGTTWNNVPNSAPYSNVNTATLDITNATTGMNNYQYRVIVSSICIPPDTSTAAILTVTVSCSTNVWTGGVNTLWEVAGNWSCGIVPDTSMNVSIPNVTNDPVISVSVVGGVRDIVIQSDAILTMIDNAILQVSGNFENNGAFDFSGNSNVVLLGNRAQTIKSSWTTGTNNSFNNLTIDKANSNTVTPFDNINVQEKTMIEKGELVIAEDIVARTKKVELKDKLLIQGVSNGVKAGEFRVNE